MPKLSKEQLDRIEYVSIQDYCRRVDELEDLEDKLAFSTRYILAHGKMVDPDYPIDRIIKVAHMKIADKSADIKQFYQETEVNKGIGDQMVDPTVDAAEKDLPNQMFIANPVAYLKGQAKALSDEIHKKQWMSNDDIQNSVAYGSLRNDVFTDEFATKINNALKKPTAFDLNARLENAFGSPKALKKAYEATKPGFLSRMFDTSSLAAKNLDTAYKAFNNPNHALHGDLPTVEKAAQEYLQHVLPDYKPNLLFNIPSEKDIADLSGTQKARAQFSINLLKAVKEQKQMEEGYSEMLEASKAKNIDFKDLSGVAADNALSKDNDDFQKSVFIDSKEEVEENLIEDENEVDNNLVIDAPKNDAIEME